MAAANPGRSTFLIAVIFCCFMFDCWFTVNRFWNYESVISSELDNAGSQACVYCFQLIIAYA